jgi:glycosyltransferase involved in cell wall biosynthesis
MPPLISVVMPVYNGERYLGEAIASVIAQEHRPLEVIVVDDGSTDRSSAIALRFGPPVRCIRQENAGAATARTRGAAAAQGEFLAFLDADDLWMPSKLRKQLDAFEADPELDMVFGHVRHFYSPDVAEQAAALGRPAAEVMPGYASNTMLVRRAAYERVGPFLAQLKRSDFIEWYGRAVDLGLKQRMLPDIIALRRLHTANMSITERGKANDFVRMAKLLLDRRRGRQADSAREPSRQATTNGHAPSEPPQQDT